MLAMFKKLFVDHPASVGESYFEHMGVAFSFGFKMLGAAFACMIHGLVPGLFKSTGSQAISCLYERMISHRCRHTGMQERVHGPQAANPSKALPQL
jgi:Family of unknown function (DUF6356)